mmetsp:Transcript_5514/g.10363  ORF Transcript_5514/g.10363 Transcript_5514/m.10363 type:complete len:106 (+) Transcript_5514:718-1035(+)
MKGEWLRFLCLFLWRGLGDCYGNSRTNVSPLFLLGHAFFFSYNRWRPILGVEAILISVLSMLTDDEPNLDSPANIDAAKLYREDITAYKRQVRRLTQRSAESYLE